MRRSTNEAIPSAKSAEFAVLARMAGISRYAGCSSSSSDLVVGGHDLLYEAERVRGGTARRGLELAHAWCEVASVGSTRSIPGKRVKSRSVVAIEAPCSSASAARCASITIAPLA